MAGEWIEAPLPDVIYFQEGPGILAKDFRDKGVPLVRLSGLDRGGSVLSGCNYLDPQMVAKRWSHFALAKGDILLSTSASLGRLAVVGDDGVGAISYTGIIRMRPRDARLVAPFIRYLLEGPDFQQQAEMVGAGSVIRHFGPMHLRQMRVRIPPPNEQHAIAHILGTLDDKIELNRRMSETLEAMARALFKSWFVDFDPVRAKMEGRWQRGQSLPGLPAHLYDLFPDRLVDSELGEIPEGWEVKGLDDIARFLNGLALQKYPPDGDESLPVIKIAQLRAGTTVGADRASARLNPDYVVANGDILFSWSGSLECVLWAGGPGALNQHLFKVTSDEYPRWLCYFAIHRHLDDFRHIAAGKATTMGHIQRHHLSDAKVVVPPKPIPPAMDAPISPMFERLWKLAVESRTLAKLRDTLLPKLISGELRVPQAHHAVEETMA
jgi:type I restriction enzyme S subunit